MSGQTTSPDTSTRATAEVATAHPSRYLQQLCKHFAHKLPVTFDATAGHLAFPIGECRLAARDDVLSLTVVAVDAAELPRLQDVVVRHLVRFAFREELVVDWHIEGEAGAAR